MNLLNEHRTWLLFLAHANMESLRCPSPPTGYRLGLRPTFLKSFRPTPVIRDHSDLAFFVPSQMTVITEQTKSYPKRSFERGCCYLMLLIKKRFN